MAVVCAKCGAEVPVGAQFCAACGTPVAAAAASVPPGAPSVGGGYTPVNIPSQPAASPQYAAASPTPPLPGYTPVSGAPPAGYAAAAGYAAPAAVSARGGGSALKIVLIIIAVLVGLGILGAGAVGFMVYRVAHAFHVNGKNGQFTVSVPNGTVSASNATNFTPEELGTEIYPGAQSITGGMRMNLPTTSIVSGVFVTPDSKEQVVAFYKSKLGADASVFDGDSSAMISLKKGSHENIMVTVAAKTSENDGKTKISIVHTKNKSSS